MSNTDDPFDDWRVLAAAGLLLVLAILSSKGNSYLGISTRGTYRSGYRVLFAYSFWMFVTVLVLWIFAAIFDW